MENRSREARRAVVASSNGGISRRRHRNNNSLRDSPEDEGAMELPESLRSRERLKKEVRDRDRDRESHHLRERDRERDRERERSSRSSKRRRGGAGVGIGERMINNSGAGDESSEESVNDEEDEDDEENHPTTTNTVNGHHRSSLQPSPVTGAINPAMNHYHGGSNNLNSHHHHHHNHHQQNNINSNLPTHANQNHHQQPAIQHRKSFPPSPAGGGATAAKVFRGAPVWKSGDEMIGVPVPRKARSASTKRLHDWMNNGVAVGGGAEQSPLAPATSPARGSFVSASSPSQAPLSPSSSTASLRKKMKPNGPKQFRPPKTAATSNSKASSSNPEELEIEIAEVLYGLMTQSQAPPQKKEEVNRSSSPSILPPNPISASGPLSAVAPKRKRPRQQVSENPGSNYSVRSSPISSDQVPKSEIAEKIAGSVAETGFDMSSLPVPEISEVAADSEMKAVGEELGESLPKEEGSNSPAKKESPSPATVKAEETNNPDDAASGNSAAADVSNRREEKFQIDLEAPPPQSRSSPERDGGEISLSMNHKPFVADLSAEMKPKQDDKMARSVVKENGGDEQVPKTEDFDSTKKVENRGRGVIDLQLDLEKPERENGNSKPSPAPTPSPAAPSKPSKDESHSEKLGQPSSMPLPVSMANWPGGLPPMGYMAPIQGVVSMDGSSVSQPPPIQPFFSQPRPKRCATHCYIARNIHCLQQMLKMNPFWPAAAAAANPASLFGSKPCNLSVAPPAAAELQGNVAGRNVSGGQDKGTQLAMFPGQQAVKDSKVPPQPANVADSNQRKQQIMLQPALPPVAPNNILHGPAFIFPINHQQAAVAAASAKPPPPATTSAVVSGSTSNPTTTGGGAAASAVSAPGGGGGPPPAAAAALSFNYPNMSATETQYLAILQNNGYPFPLQAVGAPPPNFRGTHPQPMPLFNGSFYSSQIIHPSQLQQQTPPQHHQQTPPQHHQQTPPQHHQQQTPPQHHQQHHQQGPPQSSQSPSQQMQQHGNTNQNTSSGSSSSQKHLQSQQQQQQQQQRSAGNSASLQNFQPPKNRPSQQQLQQQHMALQQQSHDAGNEDSPSTADSRGSRPPVNIYGQSFSMPMHHQNYALLTTPGALTGAPANSPNSNQSDKKQQQQQQQQAHARNMGLKNAVESSLPAAQAFAMSFGASGIDLSSMPQNQAILQSLPESARQSIQMMAANAAQAVQQRKNFRISEEGKSGNDSSAADEERKAGKTSTNASQSIAFSRSDLADGSGSGSAPLSSSVIDSSARSLNLSSGPTKNSRPGISSGNAQQQHLQQQMQQQQQQQHMMQQIQKQQQQQYAAWNNKNSSAPNTSYADHFSSTTSSPANAKFPNPHPGFPQNLVQSSNNSSSPAQSPQWKNPSRNTPPQQVPSSFTTSSNASSLKSLPQTQQQQQTRSQQNHSQISFGVNPNQKVQASSSPSQQPQNSSSHNHNHNHNQSPASPMMVGSPSNSSISKGASGSPRPNTSASASSKTGQASSLSGNQGKNSSVPGQRSSPSILGNPPHISMSSSSSSKPQMQQMQQPTPQQLHQHQQQQQQQQIAKNLQQQAQLYFSNPYMQSQPPISSSTNSTPSAQGTAGYYVQRRRTDQQQQGQPQTSNGMLSLSVSLAGGTSTSDPAKALAAASNVNLKGGGLTSQSILQAAQFSAQSSGNQHQLMPAGFAYVHTVPAAVPVKSSEQKQPAGNDNLCWQPEKK